MIRNEYKKIEDFVRAASSGGIKQIFLFEATASDKGGPQLRQLQGEAGLPGETVQVETVKKTTSILLSAHETKYVEGMEYTATFHFHEAQLLLAFVADENEDKEYEAQKEAKITAIFRQIKEKCPDVEVIEGRTLPVA